MLLTRIPLLIIFLATLASTPALAVTDEDLVETNAIRAEFDQVDRLAQALDGLREWNRDGLNTRIDFRAQRAMARLNKLAARLMADPLLGNDIRTSLEGLLQQALTLAMARDRALEERAAQERQLITKFEKGPQAEIARVFMEDLNKMRKDYLELIAGQLDLRRNAGMEVEPLLQFAHQRLFIVLEYLAGQVTLDALSLDELRTQLSENPLDEDVKSAASLVQAKQRRNLEQLAGVISVAERFALPVAEEQGLLVRERGEVGIELLRSDVFRALWTEQFSRLQQSMVRNGPDLLFRLLLFLVIMFTTWMLAGLVRNLMARVARHGRLGLSALVRDTLCALSGTAVLVAGTVIALATIGVSLGPIFAGLGVVGILVGLAVQDSLGNLAAGAMILINRPFDVDDHIEVVGASGLVKKMNWLATTIVTFDNQILVVPNRRIWGDTIVNYTANPVRRLDIKISFAYTEDTDHVQNVLLDVLQTHVHVLDKPAPQVHFTAMEDSALAMVAKPWVRTEHYWTTLWDLNHSIKKRFDDEGIEIPFPQLVVTLHK